MVLNGNIKKNMNQITKNTTVRDILQQTGTEFGRALSPQIWVNSLMAEYKGINKKFDAIIKGYSYCIPEGHGEYSGKFIDCKEFEYEVFPNWIITDMRFPNEMKAVEERDGICIRVNRNKKPIRCNNCMNTYEEDDLVDIGEDYIPSCPKCNTDNYLMQPYEDIEHESETALDNYDDWDYIIDNNGTIDDLINQVREILQIMFFKNE